MYMSDLTIENRRFRLIVGTNAKVKSLICKSTGEELIYGESTALCSVTQNRPYHNEVKLAHPNKRTTYAANRIRIENDKLTVGFEIIPYEAVIKIGCTDSYISFTLEDFIVPLELYGGLNITLPPVEEFRILQLPIKSKKYFGEWLNVNWDESCAVNIISTSPYASIDSQRHDGYRIMYADALRSVKLKGTSAALIVSDTNEYLDCVDSLEKDFGLPHGVESRRNNLINASIYWSADINPSNVDEHIAYAKKGGFKLMLLYYTSIFKEEGGYMRCGDYDYRSEYPNKEADLTKMLEHIRENGIHPGLHFLQTHIGLKSRYVTPKADFRLHLKRHFTLAAPLEISETSDIFVMEAPEDSEMADGARILKFGTELISYEGFTTERPYRFTGCKRGAWNTDITEHYAGEIGGVLDVSEFGASSVYLDQDSDLQDEVADKISKAYNCGFEFVYFDGSEGTNPPFEFHVPNAQYRVYQKLKNPPILCEGAAKAHFSWHFLSGGNAFDIFSPEIFKDKIREFPAEEAARMRQDFTRINFGWWGFWDKRTQADMYEFGTSRAAAWDCPATIQINIQNLRSHARTGDIFEVMRRWEDVRSKNWLTDKQKEELRDLNTEHILLINEEHEYELVKCEQLESVCSGDSRVRAFIFTRNGYSWAVYWHAVGECELIIPKLEIAVYDELYHPQIELKTENENILIPVGNRRYIKTSASMKELVSALESGKLIK